MRRAGKVLVIGDDMRSFLATVRSLGRQGIDVHVAPYDFSSPALASRYITRTHALPVYLDGGALWLDAVTRLLEQENFELVIPCDERSLLPLLRHEAQLGKLTTLAMPDATGMDLFFDKHSTRELARSLDIPVAAGRILTEADTAQSVAAEVGLPLILKHRKSYAWPELYVRTRTTVVDTETALANWLASSTAPRADILFEKMCPGFGVGVSILASGGKILQAFEHHRVRELDGASYYRKSAPLDPFRLDAVTRLVAAAAYTGIAMFEFKVDAKTDKWILLEVNARPWGSLPLPVSLGVDFPYRLYQLLVKGEITPSVAYREGVHGRNLVPDLWQVRTVAQSLAGSPGRLVRFFGTWLAEFRHLATGREFHDGFVKDDKRPGVIEFKKFCATIGDTVRSKLTGSHAPLPTGLATRLRTALATGPFPVDILVVCDGNICRSPYVELKLKQLLAAAPDRITSRSAGMLPRNRRQSPQVAIDAAARRGVSMTQHRSQYAFDASVNAASIILIFDCVNQRSLLSRYPALHDRIFFLGELLHADGKTVEISDPIGRSAAGFDATYAQIDICLQRLAEVVQANLHHT